MCTNIAAPEWGILSLAAVCSKFGALWVWHRHFAPRRGVVVTLRVSSPCSWWGCGREVQTADEFRESENQPGTLSLLLSGFQIAVRLDRRSKQDHWNKFGISS